MGEKFELIFKKHELVTKEIDEPIMYDSTSFVTAQEDKRLARDILFSGGEVMLKFTATRNHELDKILFYDQRYGYESKISLAITVEGEYIVLDLDFKGKKTDGVTFFSCKLIQDEKLQRIKRRRETKINVLSNKDIDGNPITPLVPQKLFINAKPTVQTSKWSCPENTTVFAQGSTFAPSFFNPIKKVELDGVEDTLSWYEDYSTNPSGNGNYVPSLDNFALVRAKNNLRDVKVVIDLNILTQWYATEGVAGNFDVQAYIIKGAGDFKTNFLYIPVNRFTFYDTPALGPGTGLFVAGDNRQITLNIGDVDRNEYIWCAFMHRGTDPYQLSANNFIKCAVTIIATSVAYNVVVPSFKLYDVMKYVIKWISGLDIKAPYFEPGGYLHNVRITNGLFLRLITDKGFTLTLKQIEETISAFFADYEIQLDGKVFFGLYHEYYRDVEIAFLKNRQFNKFTTGYNDRHCINKFTFGNKYYQSQKENPETNTADAVHGESEWIIHNDNVENSLDRKIEASLDPFYLDATIRKSDQKNNTSTSDDDRLFMIDTNVDALQGVTSISFTEKTTLQHFYNPFTGQLILRNTGDISWIKLGITIGQPFIINFTQLNNGYFTVLQVDAQQITLSVNAGTAAPVNNGIRDTYFTYSIDATSLGGVTWTDQGFGAIENLLNPRKFGNMRFSNKRLILDYYQQHLATCNLYTEGHAITKADYKNNPEALSTYGGVTIVEGEDFVPQNPILSPIMYENCEYIMSFAEFIQIQNKMRSIRGFVRSIDNDGNVFKQYIKKAAYSNKEKTFTIIQGEDKYEPLIINIVSHAQGYIINNEYGVRKLKYTFEGDRVRLTDNEGELLYNPIFWNRIGINGDIASSFNELREWLDLLD